MTDVKVVDASAVAAVLFDEPDADAVLDRLRGFQLTAPNLLTFELASVCIKKSRRDPDHSQVFLANLAASHGMGIDLLAVDQSDVAELALETGLSAYDASYLWLARQLGVELVTLDKQLNQVCAVR